MEDNMKDTLLSNIKFAYNEALEFIVSMGMIACEEQLLKAAEDYKLEMDPQVLSYHKDARARLSPHSYRELQFFFQYNFFIKHSILLSMNPFAPVQNHKQLKHG